MSGSVFCIRDYLVHLPELSCYQFNDLVSYNLWKTLDLCLKQDNKTINWNELLKIYETEDWKDGTYLQIKLVDNWREKFLKNPFDNNYHVGTSCDRQCHPMEIVYYCFDCTKNPLYEICEYCFDETKHKTHRYNSRVVGKSDGKICHCGDPSGFNDKSSAFQCKNSINNKTVPIDYNYNDNLINVLSQIFDYLIDCLIYFKDLSSGRIFMADSSSHIEHQSQIYCLQLYERDCNLHMKSISLKISRILNKPIEYGIMMVEKLTENSSFVVIVESIDRSKLVLIQKIFEEEGIHLLLKNQKDVFKELLLEELIVWLYELTVCKVDLESKLSLRAAILDMWNSNLLCSGSSWNNLEPYLSKINLLGNFTIHNEQENSFPWCSPWKFGMDTEFKHDPKILEIMGRYDNNLSEANVQNNIGISHLLKGSRFQYLLTDGILNMAQFSRLRMIKVFSILFTIIDESKKCLAAQYLDVYCTLLYNTVVSDSLGHKISPMNVISQYICQNPSIANMIIKSSCGFIERALHFAFTLMTFTPESLAHCPLIPLSFDFKLPNDFVKSKRSVTCFKDIYLIMSTNTAPTSLMQNERVISSMLRCFSSFNSILPLKREASEHVEFENFEFSSYYFFFSSILVMVDGFVRNICLINNSDLRGNIVRKLVKIAMDEEFRLLKDFRMSLFPIEDYSKPLIQSNNEIMTIDETIGDVTSRIIYFRVGIDVQNFFNPMSYFSKYVLQWSRCGRYEPLREDLVNCFDFTKFFIDSTQLIRSCESALSTLVLISQINIGFWVRNGAPIIHQLRMYTKYSMREFAYFSDIFNVQLAMCLSNPNDFLVTFLSRWRLKHWSEGLLEGDYSDNETTSSMADQCFLLLIRLFTEVRSLTMTSSVEGFEKTMKAEIIHSLCFHSNSHNALINSIPEHITKHPAFDLYLEELATYNAPTGLSDHGTYTLRDKSYEEVDPYFIGFSPTKSYEAEKLIRTKMSRVHKMPYKNTFIPVSNTNKKLEPTPYKGLYQITNINIFGLFIVSSLQHIFEFKYESMFSKVVHLIHLCLVNNFYGFIKVFWKKYPFKSNKVEYHHSIGFLLYLFLKDGEFPNEHGKIREMFKYIRGKVPDMNKNELVKDQGESCNLELLYTDANEIKKLDEDFERKKKLAKRKKDRMIKKLEKQQQLFMEKNNVFDDDILPKEVDNNVEIVVKDGWKYSDDTCVFCKIPKENNPFIFFTFFEQNVVDQYLNHSYVDTATKTNQDSCGTSAKQNTMELAHVIKTCGHGSHDSCLENHMKTVRESHSHITKNVPKGLGLCIFFCPLCHSLANSFLPKITDIITRNQKDLFQMENEYEDAYPPEKFKDICLKSLIIFHHLISPQENINQSDFYQLLNEIIRNTISNFELIKRFDSSNNFITQCISGQQLLSLRLLCDLKRYILDNHLFIISKPTRHIEYAPVSNVISWTNFINKEVSNDILIQVGLYLNPKVRDGVSFNIVMTALLKQKLHQYFTVLTREITKNMNYILDQNSKGLHNPDLNRNNLYDIESGLILDAIKNYLSIFATSVPNETLHMLESYKSFFYHTVISNICVFLRRVALMIFSDYPIERKYNYDITTGEIDMLLAYCGINNISSLFKEFNGCDFHIIKGLIANPGNWMMDDLFLRQLKIPYTGFGPFIQLPERLSDFILSEKEQFEYKVNNREIAVCLFCGEKTHIQRLTAIHNYTIGECTNHYYNECRVNLAYGCFLLIRSNTVYLEYGDRGTFYRAPYINKFGEADDDYSQGTPVYLDKKIYAHLTKDIILGGKIPHLVYRLTDGISDFGGWVGI